MSFPLVTKTAPGAEFKVSDAGEVEAIFSTFDNVDRDGDVVTREALLPFNGMEVPMVANHDWGLKGWIGLGRIAVGPTNAKFTGSFLMNTQAGKEAFEQVRAFKNVSQWSWSFIPKDLAYEERNGKPVRVVKSLAEPPFEVSPVLVGANPETRTLAIKAFAETAIEDMVKKAVREALAERPDEEPKPKEPDPGAWIALAAGVNELEIDIDTEPAKEPEESTSPEPEEKRVEGPDDSAEDDAETPVESREEAELREFREIKESMERMLAGYPSKEVPV